MPRVQAADYGEKQELIMETASELFATQGFNATSMSMLAKACGASKAWIYHYYDSKESILHALMSEYAEMLNQTLPEKVDPTTTPEQRFRDFLSRLMNFSNVESNKNRNVHNILLQELRSLPKAEREQIATVLRRYARGVMDLICELAPALKTEPKMARPVTMLVLGATNWLPRWYDPNGPVSPDELASVISQVFLNGLKNIDIFDS